ncbi:MAG: 50S ribosomal protein L1 [Alphaproteobacteria bacterium GM7ARS4]|nr:50S ribosomal protein L1 [Alphaproteobacteria bacterium GM7ARS4]
MARLSKRRKNIMKEHREGALYPLADAIQVVTRCATARFDESIDVAVHLGVDPKRSEQNVRGALVLPHGSGKNVRVGVFCSEAKQDEAKKAGADIVGGVELVEAILSGGALGFDRCVATPDMMPEVGKLGRILGPRGLMPNPKLGNVTDNVGKVVKDMKGGQVSFKTEKNAIVHTSVGRASFTPKALEDNVQALVDALRKAKPSGVKGQYIKRMSMSSSMGLGVAISVSSIGTGRGT